MKKILLSAMAIFLVFPILTYAQQSTDGMAMATLSEKMDQLGDEMDGLGKDMEIDGDKMENYGKELEQHSGQSPKTEKQMEELGEKMNKLGDEMGKLGDQMGLYGEKMGELQQQMIDWFFRELKKDGLIPSLQSKVRIIFDEKGFEVDGNKTNEAQFNKYKAGLEKYWGRSLKSDFLFFFKGTIQEKDGKIETDGSMNTDF